MRGCQATKRVGQEPGLLAEPAIAGEPEAHRAGWALDAGVVFGQLEIMPSDRCALSELRTDYVRSELVLKLGLPRCTEVVEQSRSRCEAGALDNPH